MSEHLDVTGLPSDVLGILAGVRKPLCAAYNKVRGDAAGTELLRATLEAVLAKLPEPGEEVPEVKMPRVATGPTRKEREEMDSEAAKAMAKASAAAKAEFDARMKEAAEKEAAAQAEAEAIAKAAAAEQAEKAKVEREAMNAKNRAAAKAVAEARKNKPEQPSEFQDGKPEETEGTEE